MDCNNQLKLSSWNYKIMDLSGDELINKINKCSRETIINWLQWNDRNGIYTDEQSLKEFGKILSREEGIEIMTLQILNP